MIHPHKNSLIVSRPLGFGISTFPFSHSPITIRERKENDSVRTFLILFVLWVHETVNHALLVPEGSFSSQGKGPESGYKIYNQASQNLPCILFDDVKR